MIAQVTSVCQITNSRRWIQLGPHQYLLLRIDHGAVCALLCSYDQRQCMMSFAQNVPYEPCGKVSRFGFEKITR